ncbi:MAG: hypothetical protein HY719_14220 [Planctomycetes bacterium]|nr:hypothetical protein [Planctomycetota bacterium]
MVQARSLRVGRDVFTSRFYALLCGAVAAPFLAAGCNQDTGARVLPDTIPFSVDTGVPIFSTTALPDAFQNQPYSETEVRLEGSQFPFKVELVQGPLPTGIVLVQVNPDGTKTEMGAGPLTVQDPDGDQRAVFLVRSPTSSPVTSPPGIYPVTFRVTESRLGRTTTQTFTIRVCKLPGGANPQDDYPRVSIVSPLAGKTVTSPVFVTYDLIDNNCDPSLNIRPQWRDTETSTTTGYRFGSGNWLDMVEKANQGSNGTQALTSAPGTGSRHLFVWDAELDFQSGGVKAPANASPLGAAGQPLPHGRILVATIEIRVVANDSGQNPVVDTDSNNGFGPGGTAPHGAPTDPGAKITVDNTPFTNGQAADQVIGQKDFQSKDNTKPENNFNFPVGVYSDGLALFVCDNGFGRVLIWRSLPSVSPIANFTITGMPDVVLGVADVKTIGGGATSDSTLKNPSGVFYDGTRTYVADTGTHRVLIWDRPLSGATMLKSGDKAAGVVGQPDFTTGIVPVGADSKNLNEPNGVVTIGGTLYVSSLKQNRILLFTDIKTRIGPSGPTADGVIGQDDFLNTLANGSTGGGTVPQGSVSPFGLKDPRQLATDGSKLMVADSGNNRVLIYNTPGGQAAANIVVGQPDMVTATAATISATTLNGPYGVGTDGQLFGVADTQNGRVLVFSMIPRSNGVAADNVLGVADFVTAGFDTSQNPPVPFPPTDKNVAQPQDVCFANRLLYVSDTSNNRVLRYTKPKP